MRIKYTPHEKQRLIHEALRPYCSGKEVMVVAGRRFGKTTLAVNEIIRRAIETPNSRIWYVAPTKDQAYRIAWRKMLQYIPFEMISKKREDRHSIELTNGSIIELLGVQDQVFLLGAGLHFVVFDEFPTIPFTVWLDTIKPMLSDYNGDALFIGSVPDPKVHNITREFIDMFELKQRKHLVDGEPQTAFTFASMDNPYINHSKVKRDMEELKQMGREKDIQRIYYGGYVREFGKVFSTFDQTKHVVNPFDIPGNWVRVMAVDPHPQKPIFALWIAIDPSNEYWVYREKKFEDNDGNPLTVQEAAAVIKLLEARETVRVRLIDPTFARVEQKVVGTKSVVDQFSENGLFFINGNRDFMTFYNEMTNKLKDVPHPTIHIFRTCPGLISQLDQYTWDSYVGAKAREERGVKDKPKPINDDFISCLKYILNARVPYVDVSKTKTELTTRLRARWADMQI